MRGYTKIIQHKYKMAACEKSQAAIFAPGLDRSGDLFSQNLEEVENGRVKTYQDV
jgi:hypothetical protein